MQEVLKEKHQQTNERLKEKLMKKEELVQNRLNNLESKFMSADQRKKAFEEERERKLLEDKERTKMKQQEIEKLQYDLELRQKEKKDRILNSMDEAEFALRKIEEKKREQARLKKENDILKKMARDRQIQSAVEVKQKQINDVRSKLDNMNEQVNKVLKQKEDI